ncbi:hypothetical protein PG989_004066 [Apiospora arundinis]|uniref:Uncharacterized protein n=1 Tax=Apiospora arundinis TaxID=335852 RepID=A0ABR2I6C6_9PEZI
MDSIPSPTVFFFPVTCLAQSGATVYVQESGSTSISKHKVPSRAELDFGLLEAPSNIGDTSLLIEGLESLLRASSPLTWRISPLKPASLRRQFLFLSGRYHGCAATTSS